MRYVCFALLMWLGAGSLHAQNSTPIRQDTTVTPAVDASATDLLAGLGDSTVASADLLPPKMIFTQRIFWGPKGLLRTMNLAPLTPEGRAHELKTRRTMLIAHQIGGFVTLAGFIAQGIIGAKLYNFKGSGYNDLKEWHERSAAFINVTYGTTLLLSLTAPPPVVGARKGFTFIKLHKYLAIAHLTGMVATNILAGMIEDNSSLKPYHRAAAYTTFGTYAASVLSLTF